jgi:hypothetical protein
MRYRNIDMKVDQFIGYLNDDKINLIPPFQRGHVWTIPQRRKLIANVVQGRPIPAIFLYREASGEKYAYNILDGKQRLESLMLFIGNQRKALSVRYLNRFFAEQRYKDAFNFSVESDGKVLGFKDLDNSLVRDLRDYVIPTIEITLDEDNPSGLDEIINLFVDINSTGEPVKRFDIVKAMSKDDLLRSVFPLIARSEERQKDVVYFPRKNEITFVLQHLQVVSNLRDRNSKVDRMWEMLVELVLFLRTKEHRNPVDILKGFIRGGKSAANTSISPDELTELYEAFKFLRAAYTSTPAFASSKLATNQVHFYTMITALTASNLLGSYPKDVLIVKFIRLGQIVDGTIQVPENLFEAVVQYLDLSSRQTTHVNRRTERQTKFIELIGSL